MRRSAGGMRPIATSIAWCTVPWLIIAACAATSPQPPAARPDPQPLANATAGSAAQADTSMSPMLEEIRADAARRASVPLDQVKVLSAEAVVWSDGALGCPEPGMMYTQALVPGYRIRVDAAGAPMMYHTRATSVFVLCPPERAGAAVDTT